MLVVVNKNFLQQKFPKLWYALLRTCQKYFQKVRFFDSQTKIFRHQKGELRYYPLYKELVLSKCACGRSSIGMTGFALLTISHDERKENVEGLSHYSKLIRQEIGGVITRN